MPAGYNRRSHEWSGPPNPDSDPFPVAPMNSLSQFAVLLQDESSGLVWAYVGFLLLVIGFLALDLGVFHREAHEVKIKEATIWTAVWVGTALCFNALIYFAYERHWLGLGIDVPQVDGSVKSLVSGFEAAELFFTGYVVEKSLSIDNVFVIALVFSFFAVPTKLQHRVLFWGVLGALLMRGAMIAVGAALLQNFSWIIYVFGGILIVTALKMAWMSSTNIDPEKNWVVMGVRKLFPITREYDGDKFFTRPQGPGSRLFGTPLLLALVMVEFTDVVFAVDSIPAIFAITADPFLVFTSNVFAILGLRSLYFCLASLIHRFKYLKPALIVVLLFVGVKMMLVHSSYKIDTGVSLAVIIGVLLLGVVGSLVATRQAPKAG